jgi:hypothetical protein
MGLFEGLKRVISPSWRNILLNLFNYLTNLKTGSTIGCGGQTARGKYVPAG